MLVLGVVVFGAVEAGVTGLVGVAGAAAPLPEPVPVPVPGVVIVVGVVAGRVVTGVGRGGNGLDITLAISSVMPASESLFRYLYQVERPSIQAGLFV